MRSILSRSFVLIMLALFCQLSALAQGTTGSIAGTVVDQSGATVPNAAVTIRSESGQEFNVNTDENGAFRVPALGTGFYTVTVTASNFKKVVVSGVKVDVGTPTTVDVPLEAGNITESVTISGGGEVLQTQTATVGTTITGRQITEVPLTSRDALDLITLLPGTATVGRPRASSINGLPKGSLSITIDGVDVQDNLLRSSDGFFTYVRPRLDAIEEVNVSTASPGSESSGDGAVQIKFVTKRGTNDYRGNLFWQHRDHSLNSNYWWNNTNGLPRNPIVLNQYGGSLGGPIPFLNFGEGVPVFNSGKDRAFFFVSYEEFRLPESASRSPRILNPDAMTGVFRYAGGPANGVNVLSLAAANGFTGTIDPTVGSLFSAIRSSTSQGTVTPLGSIFQNLNFINKNSSRRNFFVSRFDFNLTKNHSLENVTNYQLFRSPNDFLNGVDPIFPGFPEYGSQNSDRYSNTTAVRSTFSSNIVNEARYSFSGGLSLFRENLSPAVFDNQNGWNLNFNSFSRDQTQPLALASPAPTISNNRRVSPTFDFSDNVTWILGKHTLTFGGQYKRIKLRTASINQVVPTVTFGFNSGAADANLRNLFNTTNFPGASTSALAEASSLYALLTGRVLGVAGNAFLDDQGQYNYLGDQLLRGKINTYGLYLQDSWRLSPSFLINGGIRWQPQEPFQATSANFARAEQFADVYGVSGEGNLFKPGTLTGRAPKFVGVEPGYKAFETDWKNFAPSIGVVWSPDFGDGFLGKAFGKSSVIRAGYSVAFVREGTNVLTSILAANPGSSLVATRNVNSAFPNELPAGTLLRNLSASTFAPAPFLSRPNYPITGTDLNSTNVFDPNLKTGNVHSWNIGYQRELDKNTVVEVRYVGNRGRDLWRQYNINEFNTIENGFAAEFRLAQANLTANNAAGGARAGSFAYFGPGTGTSPLPYMLAYANGTNPSTGGIGTYPAAFFANATLRNFLSPAYPNVIGFAQNVNASAAQRQNALNATVPSNYFIVNPTTRGGGAFLVDNSANSWYNAAVIELRRRFSGGLLIQANYTYSKSQTDAYAASAVVASNFVSLRDRNLNKTLSPFDVRHSFKVNWTYELPIGKGKPFLNVSNRWADALVGGWSVIGAVRWQSGTPINFGNVQLVGMDRKELEDMIGQVYYSQSGVLSGNRQGSATPIAGVYPATFLPADVILATREAFALGNPSGKFIAPASYGGCLQRYAGECGFSNLVVHGPDFTKVDLSLSKRIKFDEKRNVELRGAFYNAFNKPYFRVGGWAADAVNVTPNGTDFGLYTNGTVYQDLSTTNDPGGRVIELILRINF